MAEKKEKVINLSVAYDAEKFRAIERYAKEKNMSVDSVLQTALDNMYKKVVPAAVRDFIEN